MIKCPHCNKSTDEDGVYCEHCGKEITKAREKRKRKEKEKRVELKTKLFVLGITIFLALLLFFIIKNQPKHADITLKFSPYRAEKLNAYILGIVFEQPLSEREINALEKFLRVTSKYDIPVTLFAPARNNSQSYDVYLAEQPSIEWNVSKLKSLSKRYALDMQAYGYAAVPMKDLPLDQQERLFLKARKAFKKRGINVKATIAPFLQYTYDTLLAAENAGFDVVILPGKSRDPFHPPSLLGGKMRLLVLPVHPEFNPHAANLVLLNSKIVLKNLTGFEQQAGFDKLSSTTWKTTVSELNDWIRTTEKMSATLTTDYRELYSTINFRNLVNGTKVELLTELKPFLVQKGQGNNSANVTWINITEGISFVLNETDNYVFVKWKE